MRYFVTGATGFVGGKVARRLLQSGDEVIALVRDPAGAVDLAELGATLPPGDVTDTESMRAPMQGADGVFHVVGWYKVGVRDKSAAVAVNIGGTRNVLELMQELKLLKGVYTSTLAVYSDTGGELADESYRLEGKRLSEYDRTKAAAHALAGQFMRDGLPLVESRLGAAYDLSVLAIWRQGAVITERLRDVRLRFGDALLLKGPRHRLPTLQQSRDFLVLEPVMVELRRRSRAPVSVGIMALILGLATLGGFNISTAMVIGASTSFLTPVGHQANVLVFGPGGYRFFDHTRVGAPLNVVILTATLLFLTFLKIGAVLYGSGYVLLAFLRADFVARLGWLTDQQLIDAVAIGQVTPGPVFSIATFIGFVLGGLPGALLATLGIFLPSFILVAISNPLIPRIRKSPWVSGQLDGANVAAVTWQLGRASLVDLPTLLIAPAALALLIRFRVNSAWLVAGGAIAGLLSAAI